MKKRHFFYFALLVLAVGWALTLNACHKEDPPAPFVPIDYTKLPAATQVGANTFGCKVNGDVWVPRVELFTSTIIDMSALISEKDGTGSGGITCNLVDKEKKQDNWMSITFGSTLFKTGIRCDPEPGIAARFRNTNGDYYRSNYHSVLNNCVTITHFDTLKNIISGTFEFTVYRDSTNLNDKIIITDGRFDLNYHQQ